MRATQLSAHSTVWCRHGWPAVSLCPSTPYHAGPERTGPYRTGPYRTIPYRTIPDRTTPDHTGLDHTGPEDVVFYRTKPHRTTPLPYATAVHPILLPSIPRLPSPPPAPPGYCAHGGRGGSRRARTVLLWQRGVEGCVRPDEPGWVDEQMCCFPLCSLAHTMCAVCGRDWELWEVACV